METVVRATARVRRRAAAAVERGLGVRRGTAAAVEPGAGPRTTAAMKARARAGTAAVEARTRAGTTTVEAGAGAGTAAPAMVGRRTAVPAAIVLPAAVFLVAPVLVALAHDHVAVVGTAVPAGTPAVEAGAAVPGGRAGVPPARRRTAVPHRRATDEDLAVEGRRRDRHVDDRTLVHERRVDLVHHHEAGLFRVEHRLEVADVPVGSAAHLELGRRRR